MNLRFLQIIVATGFFLGYIPLAPATFACLISIAIWFFLARFKVLYIMLGMVLFAGGLMISNNLSREWGKDPRQIVIDEYASLLLPLFFTPKRILPLVITLILFRLFDILKPPLLQTLERLPGAWGIMLDDLGAAIYTTIIVVIANTVNIL